MYLSLHSEFNVAALDALRVFQGLQLPRVPSMPGPRLDMVPSPGRHSLPSSHSLTPLNITFLPLFLSHSHILVFHSNLFFIFHQDLPARGPLQMFSHQQDKDWGRKAQLQAEGRNWPLFLEAGQIEIQMILQTQLEASPPRGKKHPSPPTALRI